MFDFALMNPPYNGSTHLDFLYKIIDTSDTVISIQPAKWAINIGEYNYYKAHGTELLVKHMLSHEIIPSQEASKIFGLGKEAFKGAIIIGVYKNDYIKGKAVFDERLLQIYNKIRDTKSKNLRNNFIRADKLSENGIKIFRLHRDEAQPYYENIICFKGNAREGIDFKSSEELNNFIGSIKTKLYELMYVLYDTNPAHLPYLDDYTHNWTNDLLFKEFNITEEEQEIIEETLENKGKQDKNTRNTLNV